MGMWGNHRARQAGKYAKKSYRLQSQQTVSYIVPSVAVPTPDYRMFWFTQGVNAAMGAPYSNAPDPSAYDIFLTGWYSVRK